MRTYSSNANNITTGTFSSARLPTSGVTAATYGGATQIPVVVVDSTGRVTSASNVAVTVFSTIQGTTGTATSNNGIITFNSNNGIISTGTSNVITISTSQDLRTTASPQFVNLTMTGNITGSGVSTSTLDGFFIDGGVYT